MRRNIKFSRGLRLESLESRLAPAITAVGPEFRLNNITTGVQSAPSIAMDSDGDFVAAWHSLGDDGSGNGIVARRFIKDGTALGDSFVVNTFTTGEQTQAAVAVNAIGDFVIAWNSQTQDGDNLGIFGRRYSAGGKALGGEFQINQFTIGSQSLPAIAMDAAGGFVVAWNSSNQIGAGIEVYARRYGASGAALGNEFLVNTFTGDSQFNSAVAMSALGDFVISWTSNLQDSSGTGIYAQLYERAGSLVGGEFRVNTFTTGTQTAVAAAMSADGSFAIAWQSENQASPTSSNDLYIQRYSKTGAPLGSEVLVNETTTGSQNQAALAMDASGDFVVAFTTNQTANNEVAVRPATAAGIFDPQFFANTTTTGSQSQPAIALSANGDFVLAWAGQGASDVDGIFGQRYDQSVDDAGPYVGGVFLAPNLDTPISEGGTVSKEATALVVAFSEDVSVTGGSAGANSVTNKNNWKLRRNGIDITATAITGIGFGFNSVTRRHEAAFVLNGALGLGSYQLEPLAAIQDLAGNSIDGDFNGVAGGAFVRTFHITAPPPGTELAVNTFTTGEQLDSAIATDAAGNFVVVWNSDGQDGDSTGVYAQRYTASGFRLGSEFRVNTVTTSLQSSCDVAMDQDGDFVVVWHSDDQDGSAYGVYAQRFAADGDPVGGEILVNATINGGQGFPSVAMTPAGGFIVTWSSLAATTNALDIFVRRFNSAGQPLDGESRVNVFTTGDQFISDIAVDQDGDFIVTWMDDALEGNLGVRFRRYNSAGVALDAIEQLANSTIAGDQGDASIAALPDGSFVIVWTDINGSPNGKVMARRFGSAGNPTTDEIPLNSTIAALDASVVIDGAGHAIIAWTGGNTNADIFFSRVDTTGKLIGTDTMVNTFTTGEQTLPNIAIQPQGAFVITWTSPLQDGSAEGVYAMRLGVAAAPPTVQGTQVNDGSAQRSRVTSLQVTFSESVTLPANPASAFQLKRQSDNAPVSLNAVVAGNTVTLSFSGTPTDFASLADGRYTLTVLASRVNAGNFDGNGDGTPGDDFVLVGAPANGLFRLFGDADGNGTVNTADFNAFRSAFGGSNPIFDFDNAGGVGTSDFNQFRTRFGSSV